MADMIKLTTVGDATCSTPSTASTSQGNSCKYVFDVFINHRGPDVKKGLASHIYRRLKEHGLRVFLDQPELQKGETMTSQIEEAIRTSTVHVAIFSPRYAESSWCLNELVLMLESGSTIIPVFYHVNPWELRWTRSQDGVYARALSILRCILLCKEDENGAYARALCILEKKTTIDPQTNTKRPRHNLNTIEKWRNALSTVADTSGIDLKACNCDEELLVDEIVERVLKKVRRPLLNVAKYPTGLFEKVKDVDITVSLQRQSGKPSIVGIAGLGGIGKTTLAKELFNREMSNYDRSCFLSDVRSGNLLSLQSNLLNHLSLSNVHLNNIDEGMGAFKRHISFSNQVVIVLDDVDHINQLDALFSPLKDTIHPGSLILITTRNKDLLTSSGIAESSIYTLKGLNREHSQELFCSHAFGQPRPALGFEDVVEKFLDICNGLPLSLKVLGALLCGKYDLDYWRAQLHKTSKILPSDIQSTLKISYDALDKEEKQIFLDIACFFVGEHRDTVIRILDGSGWEGWLGLRNLENRCVVEVDTENRIRMHDQVRDLGRDLAKETPELRLWWLTDSFLHNLSTRSPVRGISMVHGNVSEQSLETLADSFNLSSLKLLRAEGYFVERLFRAGQVPQLIYLRWENCPYSSLPSWISLKTLRVLYIQKVSHLQTLWQHESQAPLELRELYIRAPLSKVPKSIGTLKHLQKFVLCESHLEILPNEFCQMDSLKHLALKYCCSLQELPNSLGNLTALQSLDLGSCFVLHTLPDSVGNLTGLQSLDLDGCSTLQTLPNSVGNLTALQRLDLGGCFSLQRLPDSVGNLTCLQSLDLGGCSSLQRLPGSIGNLKGLRSFHLGGCFSLQMLPDSVGNLISLQRFHLSGCSALQTLPDSVGNLVGLQYLDLGGCSALQMLPDSVGRLTGLQRLHLGGCSAMETLPDSIGDLTGLQRLHLGGCSAMQTLQTLPDWIGNLRGLQRLHLGQCFALQTLPEWVGNLTSLQHLHLGGCSSLQTLPNSVGKLKGLQSLYLRGCSALQTLPDSVENLGLQTLRLGRFSTPHTTQTSQSPLGT